MTSNWTVGSAPRALPFVGHALRLRKGLLGFLASLPSAGDLVQIRLGPWQAYVVCQPDLTHHVLHDRAFDKGGAVFDELRKVAGNSLGTCPRQDHRRQRRLLQPAFHRDRYRRYGQVMTEQIAAMMPSWRDSQIIDVRAQSYTLASRVVSRTLFVADAATSAAVAMEESLDDLMRGIYWHLATPIPLLRKLLTPANRRFQRARVRVRAEVRCCVEDYRQDGVDHGDLLSALLAARDDQGNALADSEIHDQVVIMLIAGIETTANTLSWALHLLARHPRIRQRLYTEVDTVLNGRVAVEDDLPDLKLTDRIITETLRLYPPVWMFTRITTRDVELAGHTIPAGTTVVCSPYLIHRRADCYSEPNRFDPDRWLSDRTAQESRNAFLPFGAGARKCIGDTFAMHETTLALASIAAQWRVEHATTTPVRPAPRVSLSPRTLRMRIHRRTPAEQNPTRIEPADMPALPGEQAEC